MEGAFTFSQSDEVVSVRIGRKRPQLVRARLGLLPHKQAAILAAVLREVAAVTEEFGLKEKQPGSTGRRLQCLVRQYSR